MSTEGDILHVPSFLMYLSSWRSMSSTTVTGTIRECKINFPVLKSFTKFRLCSLGSCTRLHACSKAIPKSSIFFNTFAIYFLITHLLKSAMAAALNSFRNVLLGKSIFFNFKVFRVFHCIEVISNFSISDFLYQLSSSKYTYYQCRCCITDCGQIDLRMCWISFFTFSVFTVWFYILKKPNQTKPFPWSCCIRKEEDQWSKIFQLIIEKFTIFILFPIDGSVYALFFLSSRCISEHSLRHNLSWKIMWGLAFSFTLFCNSYFVKIPILYFLVIHFVAIFFLFFFSSQSCISSLQDFCLASATARFLLIFKLLLITCCQTNRQSKKWFMRYNKV